MKKTIQLQIEPVDNGYLITCGARGGQPSDTFSARLVATDEKSVQELAAQTLAEAFAPAKPAPEIPKQSQ